MAVQDQQQWLLSRYLKEPNPEHRNAVVAANLPLVWKVARRESERSGHSFEAVSYTHLTLPTNREV